MATDAIKWTDILIAWATLGQALFVAGGIIVALWQLIVSQNNEKSRMTDEIFREFSKANITAAIARLSTSFDPREDWPKIDKLLTMNESDAERIQCEVDILLITNLYESVTEKYEQNLISRERFLNIYDEVTLFVCHSLANAPKRFDQADYGPLMRIGRRCKDNYALANGENENLLQIPIPERSPKRFRVTTRVIKTTSPDLNAPSIAPARP